ncbi:hypothetical protein EPI10_031236 [Gossypium australe]|uniref:Uncharacterized protein n=1 Tax=Gossypium australe TaxID=47621 RepID=A0A5B6X0U4_9ROSI|nr:hypothetical protein EPI10_031236 [Gossypium australe]
MNANNVFPNKLSGLPPDHKKLLRCPLLHIAYHLKSYKNKKFNFKSFWIMGLLDLVFLVGSFDSICGKERWLSKAVHRLSKDKQTDY